MSAAILQLDRVSRMHGAGAQQVNALREVSLQVMPGELVAVMGPSGSGKSTLLNLSGLLDEPTSGDVVIDGQSAGALSAKARAALRRRKLGFVFQDFNLIPSLTASENVSLPLELDGSRVQAARTAARAALGLLDIEELADRFPQELSGGQQQRVAIARAFVGDRRLVLADEPTGALDSATGETVLQALRDRCDDGCGGLLVTHDARHAAWAGPGGLPARRCRGRHHRGPDVAGVTAGPAGLRWGFRGVPSQTAANSAAPDVRRGG